MFSDRSFNGEATMSAAVQLADRADDDALKTLLDMVSARARQFGEDQQIDAETVEAMKAAGVYRALVPRVSAATRKARRFPASARGDLDA
jgi:hypothetical protein